jgi:hypothetical protein
MTLLTQLARASRDAILNPTAYTGGRGYGELARDAVSAVSGYLAYTSVTNSAFAAIAASPVLSTNIVRGFQPPRALDVIGTTARPAAIASNVVTSRGSRGNITSFVPGRRDSSDRTLPEKTLQPQHPFTPTFTPPRPGR